MTLYDQPRLELGSWPTPLVRASRLEARLGLGPLLIKRDDLSGFALAGSKARPLEYLLGDAMAHGHDTLVVGGAAGSNFCQGAAVAARAGGLGCHIVLPGHPPPPTAANLAMAVASGAQLSFSGGPREQLDDRIRDRAGELNHDGRSAVAIPRGGANAIGSLGFARAAQELAEQLAAEGHERARIVMAVGSGASIAGLFVGASQLDARWRLTGVSVSRPRATLIPHVRTLISGCAGELGVAMPNPATLKLNQGPGGLHGDSHSTSNERAAAVLALETEGLVLDCDYTAAAFVVALRQLAIEGPPVVFWHTGGLAGAISSYVTSGAGFAASCTGDRTSGITS
ncbi:1-aminocyclopropane-1-carboxylate deaminase/D-cysteine desulfhydrase [Terrabacter sp. GCM10028922]|uniref:1-aminocyclopropane-1-carboxylate deaminase/D-cysteine desulfhydrase n=1 Tax=Terrabacter sp. GCM10028922 TaxID=3273428 RepID=UPI00360B59A5